MNDRIKNFILFFTCTPLGVSVYLISYYTYGAKYGIYTLNTYLNMVSITLVVFGIVSLFRTDRPEIIVNKNNHEYKELQKKEKEKDKIRKKKSIMYMVIATIIFLISTIFSFQNMLLNASKVLIVFFFILGIIKIDYSLEEKVEGMIDKKKKYINSVIKKEEDTKKIKIKKPILYIFFDIIPVDLILPVVICIHAFLGMILEELGLFDMLPNATENHDMYESSYLSLSLVPAFILIIKYHMYHK